MKVSNIRAFQVPRLVEFIPCFVATSAVDLDTDRAIQEIIRGPQFEDVTMFTIAYVPDLRWFCGS